MIGGPMSFPRPFYRWRPHPWHGLAVGEDPPRRINAYVEITPFDPVKYEVDKKTGYLEVDRPQRTSSLPPTLYGFIPRTYCGDLVGALCPEAAKGDGDPLDVCVVSERPISRAEVIVHGRVVGGLQMVDGGEADDKIIAVLEGDPFWGDVQDLGELPRSLVDRLEHYFSTYKLLPGGEASFSIEEAYGHEHAFKVIEAAIEDYDDQFGSDG